jgi:hypothetical protein
MLKENCISKCLQLLQSVAFFSFEAKSGYVYVAQAGLELGMICAFSGMIGVELYKCKPHH